MLEGFLGMLNPETRKATAFYAAMTVTVYDIWNHGFSQWNLVSLLLLSGVAGLSGLAEVIHGRTTAQQVEPQGKPANEADAKGDS